MERLAMSNAHQKADDPMRAYHLSQKKALEINPRHPLIKGKEDFFPISSNFCDKLDYFSFNLIFIELLRRVENNEAEEAQELALIMFRTATLRSGFMLQESADFADSVEKLMRQTLGIPEDEQIEEEEDLPESDSTASQQEDGDDDQTGEEHDEL